MANIFVITTAEEDLKADAAGKASAIFTVTNNSNKPVRAIARAKALENARQEWLDIEGETERDFSARGTQQFTVSFSKPATPAAPGAAAQPPEKFPFRLDVASSTNPDEEFAEGPVVRVEVATATEPVKKAFPWWIIAVIAGVLLIGGLVLFLVMQRGCGTNRPDFAGKWEMKDPPDNRFQFIGIMTIKQSDDGKLEADVWKINDSDTGAPLITLNGQVTGEGVAEMDGALRGVDKMKLRGKLADKDHLSVSYSLTSAITGGPVQVIEESQELVKK